MIITRTGEIIDYFLAENGIVIQDGEFSICLEYTEEQRSQYARIMELKSLLCKSDYKAIKFSDGALTEEEYAPIREQRKKWRNEINEIEKVFSAPTITREEMDEAEMKAVKNTSRKNK